VTDASRDWDICRTIGKDYVDGVLHYLVKWCPTLEPVHSLGHAKELVDEFEGNSKRCAWTKKGERGWVSSETGRR
jgi:hypothetical protein